MDKVCAGDKRRGWDRRVGGPGRGRLMRPNGIGVTGGRGMQRAGRGMVQVRGKRLSEG